MRCAYEINNAGLTGNTHAQVGQQATASKQQVSREQADRTMNMNSREFAALRASATRPNGSR
jgi:hypothetical protein